MRGSAFRTPFFIVTISKFENARENGQFSSPQIRTLFRQSNRSPTRKAIDYSVFRLENVGKWGILRYLGNTVVSRFSGLRFS